MKHIVNGPNRPYRSQLRDEQAQGTRERILEAVMKLFARGVVEVTVPAVAREAGVSIPTVYRYYKTKRELLEAIYAFAMRRTMPAQLKPPTSMADFRDGVRIVLDNLESFGDVERAAIASPGAEQVRHATMGTRIAIAHQVADAIAPELSDADRDHLARLVIVLSLSGTLRMLREHLELSADETVDEIEWVVRAVIDGRSKESPA